MPSEAVAPLLALRDASRRYGARIALDRVSFRLDRGEVLAVAGPNGAGKSTLIKAVTGALRLDDGDVRLLGEDPARTSQARRAVGVAPQEIALWGHLTVSENLEAAAALGGVRPQDRAAAVSAALNAAWCEERAHERVDALSGGWRRRANLAAALVHRPRLLILDEPTEGLDAETKGRLPGRVQALTRQGLGVLLVSHDIEEILALADRILILDAGQVVLEGRCEAVMKAAFGGRRELAVRLASPSPPATQALRELGLQAVGGGLHVGLFDDPWPLAAEAERRIARLKAPQAEAIVRPPGLTALIAWARTKAQGARRA